MSRSDHGDDAAIEALLSGTSAGSEHGSLAAFADELRALAGGPAPAPSPELASMLADGFSPGAGPAPAGRGRARRATWGRRAGRAGVGRRVAAAGAAGRAALATSVALAGITAAGAAGALPGAAQHIVATAVEAITPFQLPDQADDEAGGERRRGAGATGRAVDGPEAGAGARDGGGEPAGASGGGSGGGEGGGRGGAPGRAGPDRGGPVPAEGGAPAPVHGGRPGDAGDGPEGPGAPGATGLDAPGRAPVPTVVSPPARDAPLGGPRPGAPPPVTVPPVSTPAGWAGTEAAEDLAGGEPSPVDAAPVPVATTGGGQR
ncbi:MAG: hypothetical protein ACLGIO_01700 [Acidimicrobiia bacterium]